ncbi:MAG: ComEC/Rec2 family competence protein, partial [Actinobacteria bacterium]|nr:ComEC/Rec2 family competence protein [Actinomycetota bacterium]
MTPWRLSLAAILLAIIAFARGRRLLLVLAFTLLLGSGVMSLRQMSVTQSIAKEFMGTISTIQFQLSTDPIQTRAKVFGTDRAPANYSFLATALSVGNEGERFRLRVPIRVMTTEKRVLNLLPGQLVTVDGSLRKSKEARVAALFILRGKIRIDTDPSRWAQALGAIRRDFRNLADGGDASALIPGMVLGDTSMQSPQLRDDMRRSGLTHLVAVSGANFAIISLFALWCMQWF